MNQEIMTRLRDFATNGMDLKEFLSKPIFLKFLISGW